MRKSVAHGLISLIKYVIILKRSYIESLLNKNSVPNV
jgi:hypothetical protein